MRGGRRRRRRPRPRQAAATARFAASRTTSAPRRRASSASATPMRPDERLPTKRTASTASRVPPAVTSTRLPASDGGASSCSTRAAISSGSAIRPTPHSPSAVSPSSGPTSSTPRREQRLGVRARRRVRPHARVHRRGDAARARGARAPPRVRRLSASPCASFASVLAVHGATTSRSPWVRCA